MLKKIKKGYGKFAKENRKTAAAIGGVGAVGGLAIGGAGLIAAAVSQSTGLTPLVASVAALGAGAKKGASKLSKVLKSRTNTIADKNLSDKSTPSEVEEGEVTILDKLLAETNNLVAVVKKQEIPESAKRELQLDKDIQHKELVAAFLSLSGPKDDGAEDKKKGLFSKIMDWIKGMLKWLSRYFLWFKPLLVLLRSLWKFAARMLLVFASPAFLGIAAALLIMTNWKSIKRKAVKWINTIKSMLNKIPGINFEMTPMPGESMTPMDTGEFDEPTFTLPNVEGEPGIEPTGPGEADILIPTPDAADEEVIETIQEISTENAKELEANQLVNNFISNQVEGSRIIASEKLNQYLAAGYGLDSPYLSALNETGSYDVAINQGLDKIYGSGTEARQQAFDLGIGGVKRYDGVSAPASPESMTTTPTTLPKRMFASNEPSVLSRLDKIYPADTSMGYNSSFVPQVNNTQIERLQPNVTVVTNNVNNSSSSQRASQKNISAKETFNVANNDSVATFTAK